MPKTTKPAHRKRRTARICLRRSRMSAILRFGGKIDTVVGRFLRDRNIVRMALCDAGRRDAAEAGLFAELLDVAGTAVAHAGAEPADELVNEIAQWPAVRDAALDALGH